MLRDRGRPDGQIDTILAKYPPRPLSAGLPGGR